MYQVHRFSVGCCEHAHMAQGAHNHVRDAFRWTSGNTSGGRDQCQTILEDGFRQRLRTPVPVHFFRSVAKL